MAWIYVVTAGLLEVVWALALKKSEGFSNPPATAVFVIAIIASMAFLALALKALPVGTGYALWTGIGAIGTAILGIAFMHESASTLRLVSLGLLALGIAGLGLAGSNQ